MCTKLLSEAAAAKLSGAGTIVSAVTLAFSLHSASAWVTLIGATFSALVAIGTFILTIDKVVAKVRSWFTPS